MTRLTRFGRHLPIANPGTPLTQSRQVKGYSGPGTYRIGDEYAAGVVFDRNGRMFTRLPPGTVVQIEGEDYYGEDSYCPGLTGRMDPRTGQPERKPGPEGDYPCEKAVGLRISSPVSGILTGNAFTTVTRVTTAVINPELMVPGLPVPGSIPVMAPVQSVQTLSAVPQNGLPMTRLTRFGQRDIGSPVLPVVRRQYVPSSAPAVQAPTYGNQPITVDSAAGLYRVTESNGLRAAVADYRPGAGGSRPVANLPYGSIVRLVSNVGGSWFKISEPFDGFVDANYGIGLTPTQIQPTPYVPPIPSPQLTVLNPRDLYANRISRPIGPSIRGIGQLRSQFFSRVPQTLPPAPQTIIGPGYVGPGTYQLTRPSHVFNSDGISIQILPVGTIVQVDGKSIYSNRPIQKRRVAVKLSSPIIGNLSQFGMVHMVHQTVRSGSAIG